MCLTSLINIQFSLLESLDYLNDPRNTLKIQLNLHLFACKSRLAGSQYWKKNPVGGASVSRSRYLRSVQLREFACSENFRERRGRYPHSSRRHARQPIGALRFSSCLGYKTCSIYPRSDTRRKSVFPRSEQDGRFARAYRVQTARSHSLHPMSVGKERTARLLHTRPSECASSRHPRYFFRDPN